MQPSRISLPQGLMEALFVVRRNRFVAEVEISGQRELAHVPSSGRMTELLFSGARVFIAPQEKPGVKLKYKILLAEEQGVLVSVDSLLPNRLVRQALLANTLPELSGYERVKPEAPFGQGRFDFFLQDRDGSGCYLEVKSVTLVREGVAIFPDAPSERGVRHMVELAAARREGFRAVVLFVIQRTDACCFEPNWDTDGQFSHALSQAAVGGVEVLARRCRVSLREVVLDRQVPVRLG